jgi:protein polybromo-1
MNLLLVTGRPTEIPEQDVYVCESVYDEARRQVKKLPREGLKKYSHSNAVTEDEIYFFRRLINPPKVLYFWKPCLLLLNSKNALY